jgi:O-antigen ligase
MLLATCAVTAVTLVVFGALGGLMLLVGLNGVSERTGGFVILGYVLLVLAGNFAVALLFNWLIARRRYAGTRGTGWAPLVVALCVTGVTALVGPPLAVALIKIIF